MKKILIITGVLCVSYILYVNTNGVSPESPEKQAEPEVTETISENKLPEKQAEPEVTEQIPEAGEIASLDKGWEFRRGNVIWKPEIEASDEKVRIRMPAMANGEYYNCFAKSVPVSPGKYYLISLTADSRIDTSKDVLRLCDGESTQFGLFKKGITRYEFLFRVHGKASRLQVALLAANASGSRGEFDITFSEFKFEEFVSQESGDELKFLPGREYAVSLEASRKHCESVLDKTMRDFVAMPLANRFKIPDDYKFSADNIPEPGAEQLKKMTNDKSLVRKMPYPYFSALSIPSDCCGSSLEDMFYTQGAISREFGLDFTSSFFAHSDYSSNNTSPAFFCEDSEQFAHYSLQLEGVAIDRLPLLLTYYYRGWIDHLHSWSNGGMYAYPLAPSKKFSCVDGWAEGALDLYDYPGCYKLKGLVVYLKVDDSVSSFRIKLTDNLGAVRDVVWKSSLRGKHVWDLSAKTVENLNSEPLVLCFDALSMQDTSLPDFVNFLKEILIETKGPEGASLKVESIVPFGITRDMIRKHAVQLSQANIRPYGLTNHGGFSYWDTLFLLDNDPVSVEMGGGGISVVKSDFAAQKSMPAFCADIVRNLGVLALNYVFQLSDYSVKPVEIDLLDIAGVPYLLTKRRYFDGDTATPKITVADAWMGELGRQVAGFLETSLQYGRYNYMYTHFNVYPPDTFFPEAADITKMSSVKRFHPYTIEAFKRVANMKYNLDGKRKPWQRVWAAPFSTIQRHQHAMQNIEQHAVINSNAVRVTSWKDKFTGRQYPEAFFEAQDLHGVTFYVPDSRTARLYVDDKEITSLKRNPPDFTGRESVTVVDTCTPTSVFDELDVYERNGRLLRSGASYYFQRREAYSGDYSMEVQAETDGFGKVTWEPYNLHSHETSFVRFSYRKTNPASCVYISWRPRGTEGDVFVATDGGLDGRQGWTLPHFEDTDYHEVVLDYSDMQAPNEGLKFVPRCYVGGISLGLSGCSKGDSVFFDSVEFLSARGVRPRSSDGGYVIGGRISPERNGLDVVLSCGDKTIKTQTCDGGWYRFENIPSKSVFALTCTIEDIPYYPDRGRLAQAVKNDLEYNIHCDDSKCNSIPRAFDLIEQKKVSDSMANRATGASEALKKEYGSLLAPHSIRFYAGLPGWDLQYVAEYQANNYGFLDKDRRFENKDDSLRILLLGECWTEGLQTTVNFHYATVLESILRRKLNRNVEVITYATSNASIGANTIAYEKYGRHFKPDILVLLANSYMTVTMNGDLQKNILGWDPKHSPYRMFDLNEGGSLAVYEADDGYPAFTEKPVPVPEGSVPWGYVLSVKGDLSSEAQKALDLTGKVLTEYYVEPLRKEGGKVAVVFGYQPALWTKGSYGGRDVNPEFFYKRMNELCRKVGAEPVNIAGHLGFLKDKESPVKVLTWENDSHLSPVGNYILARALAEEMLRILSSGK